MSEPDQITTTPALAPKTRKQLKFEAESYYIASQWQLMWRKFKSHKLAMVGSIIVVFFVITGVLFCEFFATQDIYKRNSDFILCPPQKVHFLDADGKFHLRPFVYDLVSARNPDTFGLEFEENTDVRYPIYLFVKGDEYELWGLFKGSRHFIGIKDPDGIFYLFGTDKLGRDLFSRAFYAARISLSIGFVGVIISFVLGCILGGISGYFGGKVDMLIQRIIEFLSSIPQIPLWMGLAAAIPRSWPALRVYFMIIVILSTIGWTGLARVVRGYIISLRDSDLVTAAVVSAATMPQILVRHLLPAFLSYLIVHLTLAIPSMILAETSLSFLGLGLRPPVVSWGVLLNAAQNVKTVYMNLWLMIPAFFVIITVLAFNFIGDGLRDAADPYK